MEFHVYVPIKRFNEHVIQKYILGLGVLLRVF